MRAGVRVRCLAVPRVRRAKVCVVWTAIRSERVRGSLGPIGAHSVCRAWRASNSHL